MAVLVDLHTHTLHSHAKDTVEAMAASAHAKGLAIYGLSEHSPRPCEYAYPADYREKLETGFLSYITDALEMKKQYQGKMEVLLALEMDFFPKETALAKDSATNHPYDYVIGGLHFLGHWGFDYTASDWADLSDAACIEHFVSYYHTLALMAETGLFQIAAHPDLVKLFRKETFAAWVATSEAGIHVRAALTAMKKAGMAMEISSAALRKGLGEPYPCRELMAIARDIALPVSFASDAHTAADVAYRFDALAAYAREYGYTESAVFRRRVMDMQAFA